MIRAETRTGLTSRLVARARALAEARAVRAGLARRDDVRAWRRARLLWPLFSKG